MRLIILFLFLTAFGCSHIPPRAPSYILCEPDITIPGYGAKYCGASVNPQDLRLYFEAFEEAWNADPDVNHNPEKLHGALNRLDVYFQSGVFSRPGTGGSAFLLGLTYPEVGGRALVFVIRPFNSDLTTTALAHELIHVAYSAIDGDPHGKHLGGGKEWPETVLRIVRHTDLLYKEYKR